MSMIKQILEDPRFKQAIQETKTVGLKTFRTFAQNTLNRMQGEKEEEMQEDCLEKFQLEFIAEVGGMDEDDCVACIELINTELERRGENV